MAIEFNGKLDDLVRMQKVSAENGWLIGFKEANDLWSDYSETSDAGWLSLPQVDEDLWKIIAENIYCDEECDEE